MNEQATSKIITKGEEDRQTLARRMHEAVLDKLVPENGVEEEVFQGMEQHVVLGAIADLAELLIVDSAWAGGDCNWREMVGKVHGEMLKWLWGLENC
jgi:hypothetical protein